MINIKEADFMKTFPPALKKDEKLNALGMLISEELHINAQEIERNIIYKNIDRLPEKMLDMLAYDLHIDWYGYDYEVEIKREIVKNCIMVHKKLGTKYAVETALSNVYGNAKIEEWFEYGGSPYHFRINVDISEKGLKESVRSETEKKIIFYKNLRSHCECVIYNLETEKSMVKINSYARLGGNLKVKTYLEKELQSEITEVNVFSGVGMGENLKVKAYLEKELQSGAAKETMMAGILKVNSIRVKAKV